MQIHPIWPFFSSIFRGTSYRFINAFLVILIAAAALSACGDAASDAAFKTVFNPCEALTIVAQAGTTPAELDSLDAAITMWNAAAGLQLQRADLPDAAQNTPHIPVYFEDGAPFMHGYYSDEMGTVTVNHKLKPHQHTITAAHELGHAFGLKHVALETRESLMNHGNLHTDITAADVETLHDLWPTCQALATPQNNINH